MADILALGEILIDLTQTGIQDGIPQYAANPGGAPANVAVAAARLGARSAFIGKVGKDAFGRELRRVLRENGVEVDGLLEAEKAPTTVAVVSVDGAGERSFTFYRDRSADTLLTEEEAAAAIRECPRFFHIGSVSLTAEPSRAATLGAARYAKSRGALISYDPNYRPSLWQDEGEALRWMKEPFALADVVKLSEEELPLLTGCADLEEGSRLVSEQGVSLVLVTLGEKGAYYRFGELTGAVDAVRVKVRDTNGAGDTFLGALLSRLVKREQGLLEGLGRSELESIVAFSNRAAAITCSRSGAIPAMPLLKEMI